MSAVRRAAVAVVAVLVLGSGCSTSTAAAETSPSVVEPSTGLRVATDRPDSGYSRDRFGDGWASTGRGCDTRDAVLVRDVHPVTNADRCGPLSGTLHDPYTGRTVVGPTRALDVDHVVPLALAWRTGAASWTPARREAFANDPTNLRTTTAAGNRSKGDDGPEQWLPAVDRCGYARTFAEIVRRHDLSVTPARAAALDAACR